MKEMEKLKTGTTTVGILGRDFVVLAAERKATIGYLVASKNERKILKLDTHIAMTTAGSVGDAQALERLLKAEMRLYELEDEKKMTVKEVATLLSNILHAQRFFPYFVQLMIAGYDTKPNLFSFDPSGSVVEETEYFSTGSGSVIAFGVLEDKYKKDLKLDDAIELAVRAIRAATQRDIASGGSGIDVAVIDKNGFRFIEEEKIKKILK